MRVLKRTWPYDMWSLGVTWLELVMGTPHVFQVDPRTRVKLYHQLRMDAMSDVRLSPLALHASGDRNFYRSTSVTIDTSRHTLPGAARCLESGWCPV